MKKKPTKKISAKANLMEDVFDIKALPTPAEIREYLDSQRAVIDKLHRRLAVTCDKVAVDRCCAVCRQDQFDRLTAAGYKLDMLRNIYVKQ